MSIQRGDMYFADLSPVTGEEAGGICTVLIVSGDNSKATVIVAPITKKPVTNPSPVWVTVHDGGLFPSTIMLDQVRAIDKSRLKSHEGSIDPDRMQDVDAALRTALGL